MAQTSKEKETLFSASEVIEELGIPRSQQLSYIVEHKANDGYIKPLYEQRGAKHFLYIRESDMPFLRLVWDYVKDGVRYPVAFSRAVKDVEAAKQTSLPGTLSDADAAER